MTILHNERWEDGQSTSLRAATMYADARGHRTIVVGLGDQPGVPTECWQAVAAAGSDIAAADFGNGKRPPVKLTDAMWSSLPVSGDEGARALMRERPEMVESVPCVGNEADVDTLEDLRRWS